MRNQKLPEAMTIFLIIFFLGCLSSSADTEQKAAWKGKVEMKEGIKVIKNPTPPVYGEYVPQLEEDVSIGEPNDETYYFPRGASLNVDDEGNFYVSDYGNKRVQMYDQFGKYVRTIGRQGQGPGEYLFPGNVHFDYQGNLCVSGGRELVFYTKDATFLKKTVLRASLNFFILGPGGTVIGKQQPRPDYPMESVIQLDPEGNIIRTIAEFPGLQGKSKNAFVWHWYSPSVALTAVTPEVFAYGYSGEYKIYLADAEGRTVLIMTKEEKPQSISGKEQEAKREEGLFAWFGNPGSSKPQDLIEFPAHRPFFGFFMADDAGRIYISRSKSILEKKTPGVVFDVFSKDGIYLYQIKLGFRPEVIKKGFIYEIRRNEDSGDIKIIRHKVTNWTQFKSGL